jgi:hypothetical protein
MVTVIRLTGNLENTLACSLLSTVGTANECFEAHWAAVKKFKHCSYWLVAKLMLQTLDKGHNSRGIVNSIWQRIVSLHA